MSFHSFFYRLQSQRKVRQAIRGHAGRQPRFEALEDRCLLSLTAVASYPAGDAGGLAFVSSSGYTACNPLSCRWRATELW